MTELSASVVRWVADEPFPGLVEVQFVDAHGRVRSLIDKTAIFDSEGVLTRDASLPLRIGVGCEVLTAEDDQIVSVILLHDVEATDGTRTFLVRRGQLTP